jgi:hypothetical protein
MATNKYVPKERFGTSSLWRFADVLPALDFLRLVHIVPLSLAVGCWYYYICCYILAIRLWKQKTTLVCALNHN